MNVERIRDEGQQLRPPTGNVLGVVETRADFEKLVPALQAAGFDRIESLFGDGGVRLLERVSVLFRADFFNIFNHPNFASPTLPAFIALAGFNGIDTTTGRGIGFLPIVATPDTGIGYPSLGGGAPRNIQFSLKLIF